MEYWHHNAEGDLLLYRKDHNTITGVGLEAAMQLVINASLDIGTQTDGDGLLTEVNTWDQIALLDTADGVTDGVTAANILLKVDGGPAQNLAQGAGAAKYNPADGAYTDTTGSGTDGKGEVTLKFLADGNPDAAVQMVLGRFPIENNSDDNDASNNLASTDILASITINVDLADTDTLTITWTLDFDP